MVRENPSRLAKAGLDGEVIGNFVHDLVAESVGTGACLGEDGVGEDEVDAPIVAGTGLLLDGSREGAELDLRLWLLGVDEIDQAEREKLAHRDIPRVGIRGQLLAPFLSALAPFEPRLVEGGVAVEVSHQDYFFLGGEEWLDLGEEDAGLADADVVSGGGKVDDEDVHPAHLAVQVAVPHVLHAFLEHFDGRH